MFNMFHKFKDFIGLTVLRYFLVSVIIGIVWFLVESSFVFVLQGFLFSIGLLQKSQVFLPEWYPTSLKASVLILVAFGFARAVVFMTKNHFAIITQITFTCDQRGRLLSFFLKNAGVLSSKNMIATFSEVTTQSGNVIYYLSILINSLIAALLFFIFGLSLAPVEMLIGIGILFLLLFPLKIMSKKINNFGVGLVSEWEKLSESLLRGIRNYFFLAVYNQIDNEVIKGHRSLITYRSHYYNYSLISSFIGAFPLFIGVSALSLITYVSITYLNTDSMKLISFFYLFIRLAQTASETNLTFSSLNLNLPGFKILYEWNLRSKASDRTIRKSIKEIVGEEIKIELENVSLRYDEQSCLFQNINLKIEKGDLLIIKGESGSGKSSLLSLLLNINLPTTGAVLLNSFSTNDFNINLDKILGYVGPEPFMLQGTVRENLQYGNSESLLDDDIWLMLEMVELFDVVNSLPLQLEEKLSDVSRLSTGQKQRLSFARALLRKPKFLVLDEATANLDPETEKKIIENIKDLVKGCLTVVVTHKDSFDSIGTKTLNLNSIKKEVISK